MFTGIVETTGKIIDIQNGSLTLTSPWSASTLTLGQSICVDGCCLTLVSYVNGQINFQLSPATLSATIWSQRKIGDTVNLEKSLSLNTLMDGHMVSGHVDGTGLVRKVTSVDALGSWEYWIDVNPKFMSWLIPKGSVAVNGVSLTVNGLDKSGFSFTCIPHTHQVTNLSFLQTGSMVNLEFDVIAKYIQRVVELRIPQNTEVRK